MRRAGTTRLARLFGYEAGNDNRVREVYGYNCPEGLGPNSHYNSRLLHQSVEGRELYGFVPCDADYSLSQSGSLHNFLRSSGSQSPVFYLGRLLQQNVEGRELYALENPCCPISSLSSSSSSSKSSSSSSSSSKSSSSSSGSFSSQSVSSSSKSVSGSSRSASSHSKSVTSESGIITPCCPYTAIPFVVYATLAGGCVVDGLIIPMPFQGIIQLPDGTGAYQWLGCVPISCGTADSVCVNLLCNNATGQWTVGLSFFRGSTACGFTGPEICPPTDIHCGPPISGTSWVCVLASVCNCCNNTDIEIIIST